MKRTEKLLDFFTVIFLIVVGSLGIFVSILDFIGTDFESGPWRWIKGPLPLILLISAILALALGLERFTRFQELNRRISKMEQKFDQIVGTRYQFIEDYDRLYEIAADLVRNAKQRIRVSAFYLIIK